MSKISFGKFFSELEHILTFYSLEDAIDDAGMLPDTHFPKFDWKTYPQHDFNVGNGLVWSDDWPHAPTFLHEQARWFYQTSLDILQNDAKCTKMNGAVWKTTNPNHYMVSFYRSDIVKNLNRFIPDGCVFDGNIDNPSAVRDFAAVCWKYKRQTNIDVINQILGRI